MATAIKRPVPQPVIPTEVVLTLTEMEAKALACLLYRHVSGYRRSLDAIGTALYHVVGTGVVYNHDGGSVYLRPVNEGIQ